MQTLINEIKNAGFITDLQVVQLRSITTADGVIDNLEADCYIEINNAITGNDKNSKLWPGVFAVDIASFVLEDQDTPNEVDSGEANWLNDKFLGDGEIDSTEKATLLLIKTKATKIDSALNSLLEKAGV